MTRENVQQPEWCNHLIRLRVCKSFCPHAQAYWFLCCTIMPPWKLLCELFICCVGNQQFLGQDGWVMTEGQQAARASLSLCAVVQLNQGATVIPVPFLSIGQWDSEEKARGKDQTVLLLITVVLELFPWISYLCIFMYSLPVKCHNVWITCQHYLSHPAILFPPQSPLLLSEYIFIIASLGDAAIKKAKR